MLEFFSTCSSIAPNNQWEGSQMDNNDPGCLLTMSNEQLLTESLFNSMAGGRDLLQVHWLADMISVASREVCWLRTLHSVVIG